jgi:hypothetical protein
MLEKLPVDLRRHILCMAHGPSVALLIKCAQINKGCLELCKARKDFLGITRRSVGNFLFNNKNGLNFKKLLDLQHDWFPLFAIMSNWYDDFMTNPHELLQALAQYPEIYLHVATQETKQCLHPLFEKYKEILASIPNEYMLTDENVSDIMTIFFRIS